MQPLGKDSTVNLCISLEKHYVLALFSNSVFFFVPDRKNKAKSALNGALGKESKVGTVR